MKIIADENITGLPENFSAYGDLVVLPGREICTEHIHDADALLVRSVTKINEELLINSNIRFVGSCTIGTDHLDIDYLERQRIHWAYAPGCNAQAVVDYVLACLLALELGDEKGLSDLKIGIVGCGNVGGLLNRTLQKLGVEVLCCDPFLADSDSQQTYIPLEELMSVCDVICLHAPLTRNGKYPTHHLINQNNLSLLKPNAILLNAGRGGVVDNQALLEYVKKNPGFRTVLDVWENEPSISTELLKAVSIATPHIAGYSEAGKWRGTQMIYKQFCETFSYPISDKIFLSSSMFIELEPENINLRGFVLNHYDPFVDSKKLKAILNLDQSMRGDAFDKFRKKYPLRKEFIF